MLFRWFNVKLLFVPWIWAHSVCKLAVSDSGLWFLEFIICYFINIWQSQYLDETLASCKTPRAAKHTKVCASEWEYGANDLQPNLWHGSKVTAKNWFQLNHCITLWDVILRNVTFRFCKIKNICFCNSNTSILLYIYIYIWLYIWPYIYNI